MRARDVIGKRIVSVRQSRYWNENLSRTDVALYGIELEDGTVIRFDADEDGKSGVFYIRSWTVRGSARENGGAK